MLPSMCHTTIYLSSHTYTYAYMHVCVCVYAHIYVQACERVCIVCSDLFPGLDSSELQKSKILRGLVTPVK